MRGLGGLGVRAFGPKPADAPSIGKPCPACQRPFVAGDFTALVPLGPGEDEENRAKAAEGRPYTAVAVEVHYACHTGEEPEMTD